MHLQEIFSLVLKVWVHEKFQKIRPSFDPKLSRQITRWLSVSFYESENSTIGLRSETPLGRQVLDSLSESKSFPRESLILFESDLISDAFEHTPVGKTCEENFHNHSKC